MKNKLTYFISRASMFGIGFFLIFKNAQKDAWISLILGTILGVIVIYIYSLIKEYFQNINYNEALKRTKIGYIYLGIFLLFYLYLLTIILVLLPMFVNSFYLLYTPKILVVLPFLLIAIYLSYKGKNTLISLSNLLFCFSIVTIIICTLLLTLYIDYQNILPIFTNSTFNIIKSSLIYASITSIPSIITINYSGNNFKEDIKEYLLASLLIFIFVILIIFTLGENLLRIYSFPEYALLKQIKIFNFIENVENIFTCIWYFDMFISVSVLTTNIKDILPKEKNTLLYIILMVFITILSVFIIGSNYQIIITLFYYYPLVLFIFFILFTSLLFYLKYSNKFHK